MQPPAAVLFDVGNTLLEERWFDLETGIRSVVGDRALARELSAAFRARVADDHAHRRETMLADWLRYRVSSLATLPVEIIEDTIWDAVVTLDARPGAHQAIERLHSDAIPMAAVSNAAFSGRVLSNELRRHDLLDRLRFVLSSGDLGWRKPAKALFDEAMQRLGIPADRGWLVGDTFAEDIVGAHLAGMQPIWLTINPEGTVPEFFVPVVRDWTEFIELYNQTCGRTNEFRDSAH